MTRDTRHARDDSALGEYLQNVANTRPALRNPVTVTLPPAMFREGGGGARTRAVTPRDNMGAGACIGNQCRGLPNGTRVRIVVE